MFVANGLKDVTKDTALMNHFAYLFIREHPVIFEKNILEFGEGKKETNPTQWVKSLKLEENQQFLKNSNIFEAVQSTNWNNMRFKPSKSFEGKNSWLVEFRPFDLPTTSREKYYLVYFVSLFQRILTDPKIFTNFYIPISLADKNMLRSVKRNAVLKEKFFFRRNFYGDKARDTQFIPKSRNKKDILIKRKLFMEKELVELTLEELMLGGESHQGFKGLIEKFIELNKDFLKKESARIGEDIIQTIWECFDFFLKRSSGKLLTSAALIRKFVMNHKDYKGDSVVEGKIADDLIEFLYKVQSDDYHVDLFG
jgi:glutamate--cysteine ligase catalytic subunit